MPTKLKINRREDTTSTGIDEDYLRSGNDQATQLAVSSLTPNPYQPRQLFDPESLQSLADSMAAEGQLSPIIVYTDEESGDTFIAAGERRWRAAQLLKWDRISVIHKGVRTSGWARVVALLENIARADLTPYEKALGLAELSQDSGFTLDELSRRVGMGSAQISKYLKVARHPELMNGLRLAGESANFTAAYNRAKELEPDARGRPSTPAQPPASARPPSEYRQPGTAQAATPPATRVNAPEQSDYTAQAGSHQQAREAGGTARDSMPRVVKAVTDNLLVGGQYMSLPQLSALIAEIEAVLTDTGAQDIQRQTAKADREDFIERTRKLYIAAEGLLGNGD